METPTVKQRVGAAFVAATLAAGMAVPAMAVPGKAYATDASVTVTSSQPGAAGITYDVYELFKADIDATDKADSIAWATGVDASAVAVQLGSAYTTWLAANGHTGADAATNAQNAAEYIASAISGSAGNGATPPSVQASSFAQSFAQWAAQNLDRKAIVAAGTAFTGEEGYYLFVTTPATVNGKVDAATNAIWVPVGGSATTIVEKAAAPTVVKKAKEDSAGWGDAADANRAQDVDYKLEGTLPSDLQAYSEYWYKFTDTLDAGLDYKANSAAVKVVAADGMVKADITDQVAIAYTGNVLTVEVADLKALLGVAVAATDTIRVEYKASLNGQSIVHNAGSNDNTVYLEYTNNPITLGHGKSVTDTVKAYTYQMGITKTDKATGEALSGVKFTVQVVNGNSDAASAGKYVQADGSLGTTAHEFETDAQGKFSVPRIDEGTYIIHEVSPKAGYKTVADTTLVLASNIADVAADETGATALVLTGTVTGGDGATGSVSGGTASVAIQNAKETALPLTGGAGTLLLTLAGAAGIGVGIRILHRKDEDKGVESEA